MPTGTKRAGVYWARQCASSAGAIPALFLGSGLVQWKRFPWWKADQNGRERRTGDEAYLGLLRTSTGIFPRHDKGIVMSLTLNMEPPPLVRDPDGVVRVGGTRVTLDTVVEAFHEGLTAEAIVEQYPSLRLGEVYSVLGYYLRHQIEVDAYLRDRERFAAQIRKENEARFNPIGVRERLLARRRAQG